MDVYQLIELGSNVRMEEKDIFRANLHALIKAATDAGALKKTIAERLGYEPSRFSHLTSKSNYRDITAAQARAMEKKLRRPKCWLDTLRTDEEMMAAWLGLPFHDNPHLYRPQSVDGYIPMNDAGVLLMEVSVPQRSVDVPLIRDLQDIETLGPSGIRMRPGVKPMFYKTSPTLSENAVAYQVMDGLLDPAFEAGTVFVFDAEVKPRAKRPVLVDIAGTIQIRLYRPLFGDVYELYTPSGALGILRSDQAPIKILAGMLRAVLEDEQSRQ
jgi:hypothetical protein